MLVLALVVVGLRLVAENHCMSVVVEILKPKVRGELNSKDTKLSI